jgi:cysteine desulfurase/selenocysteine lyase
VLDPETRRADFPTLEGMTYLNTAAEGIPPLAVRNAYLEYFADRQQGAPGRAAHARHWEAARAAAARILGMRTEEIALCSCSSEAFNLAALALRLQPGDEVVITDLDFPAGQTPWLLPTCPATVRLWQAREGALRTEDLVPLLGPRTRLVTLSLVSYYNGHRVPVQEVAATVRARSGALLAVDITQALGRLPLVLTGADLVISSTHKWILATHGGGIVGVPRERAAEWTVPAGGWFNHRDPFARAGLEAPEPLPGAASFAVGMPNYPAVYAIRAALEYLERIGIERIAREADPLVRQCLDGLRRLPVEILTPDLPDEMSGILAFRHPRMQEIHAQLAEQQIHLMCSAGRLRISIHGYNTAQDVERFLRGLHALLARN